MLQSAALRMRSQALASTASGRQSVRLSGRIGLVSQTHVHKYKKAAPLRKIHAALTLKNEHRLEESLQKGCWSGKRESDRVGRHVVYKENRANVPPISGTISDKTS